MVALSYPVGRHLNINFMKKSAAKEIEKCSFNVLKKMTEEERLELAKKILPEGERVKSMPIGWDRNWWYISKYITIDEGNEERKLVIVRSWNKPKGYWQYKALLIGELLFSVHLDNEHKNINNEQK